MKRLIILFIILLCVSCGHNDHTGRNYDDYECKEINNDICYCERYKGYKGFCFSTECKNVKGLYPIKALNKKY